MTRRRQAEDNTDGGFLGRWSKRKARSVQGRPSDETEDNDVSAGVRELGEVEPSLKETRTPDGGLHKPGETPQENEEPVKTDADMPDLESIDESTNLSDFFSPGVSEQLRNQALRRLFHTSKFNVVDPLDDYNESFRDFELLGDLVTSDMRHRLEMDEQRQKEAEENTEGQARETAGDAESELGDDTTEPGESREDQDEAAEPERVATDSRHGDAPPAGRDETNDDSDAESRNKT